MCDYADLPILIKKSSSSVGHFIALGRKFLDVGIRNMDDVILPKLPSLLGSGVIPHCLPSYAILVWFTLEVSIINYLMHACFMHMTLLSFHINWLILLLHILVDYAFFLSLFLMIIVMSHKDTFLGWKK